MGVMPVQDRPVPVVVVDAWIVVMVPIARVLVVGSACLVVDEVLDENAEIKEERDEGASEPAEVDEHVFAIDPASLARCARPLAVRLIRENGQCVGDVAQACEKEEEHTKPVGGLASSVQDELGHARGNVCDSTEVSKDLSEKVEFQWLLVVAAGLLSAARGLLAKEPAQDTSGADHDNDSRIPQNGLNGSGPLGRTI